MSWHPHVTVATIVQRNDRYLMVEEQELGETVINQPAGHLEEGETLFAAAIRETLEETAWEVRLQYCSGLYLYTSEDNGVTYLRVAFVAEAVREMNTSIDPDIAAVHWLTLDETLQRRQRSPMVRQCILDAASGLQIPLSAVQHLS